MGGGALGGIFTRTGNGISTGGEHMKSHRSVLRLALACAAGALIAPLQAGAQSPGSSIEGVWRVIRHGVNCQTGQIMSTFTAIMSFSHGGSLNGYGVPPGS